MIASFNQDFDLHQTQILFSDPQDSHAYTFSSILIYSGFYYPCSKQFVSKIIKKAKSKYIHAIETAITHLFQCLQRQAITGPSSSYLPPSQLPQHHHSDSLLRLSFRSNQEKVHKLRESICGMGLQHFFQQGDIAELAWYNCSQFLSLKSVQQHREGFKQYESELELQGESWLQTTPFASLFCTLNFALQCILQDEVDKEVECKLRLVWARLSFLHNKCLKNPVKKLCETILCNYSRVLELRRTNISREEYIELLLEYAFALLFYYKYNRAESILRHCSNILQMKIEFTGKMGRRTKYQQFDTPQLVMNIASNQEQAPSEKQQPEGEQDFEGSSVQLIDAKQLVARQKMSSPFSQAGIKASSYNEESILLQVPKFAEGEGQEEQKEINEHHLLVSLAILYFQWRSSPHDEMQYQNIAASAITLLKFGTQTSFSYNFSLLLLRSLNEFHRVKHAERALDQFQNLRLAYNNKASKAVHNLYSTPYETHLGYLLILADKYMEIGLSLTAIELFEQAGLYEQCVDVLIKKDYKEKALEIISRLVEQKGKNPRLLCMLGDIHKNEVKYYEEAWQMSKQRSSRAMRSLGWIYYYRKDFEKAAECFANATQVSYYHPSTWFTLGCCYMNCKDYDRALRAFVECVSIDETQGEAWGNIASCYMHQKKMKEAFSTLEQAVKYSESSWMLWANLIKVSLLVRKFYKYFEAIERVVKLGHQEVVTEEVMHKVVQVMSFMNDSDERRRVIYNYRNRINKLYEYLQQNIGVNPLVWRSRCEYQIQILEYVKNMGQHYHHLHSTNTLNPNDIVPGFETLESTVATVAAQLANTKANIVAYKQCELNMTMKVGWEQNKLESEKVKRVLGEYVETYRKYSDRGDKEDFRLFVKGISQKIGHCLEEQVEMDLKWLQ